VAPKLKSLPPQALDLDNISGVASRFHYTFLQLRALGFIADEAADTDPGKCVRASLEGLRIYWSTPSAPRMRAYGLYESLAALAENSGSWELAYGFNREAALALPEGAYQLYAAMAWTRTAQLAMVLGRKQATQDAVARSAQLLAQVPEPETVALYKADGNISLARMQLEQGNTAAANNALSEAERLLPHDQNSNKIQVTNYTIVLPFYTARARVAMALPHPDWPTARDALDFARSFAEQTLASLEDYHERLRLAREAGPVYREQVVLDLDYAQSPQQALKDWERFQLFPDTGTNPGGSFTGKFLGGVLEAAYRAPAQTPIPEVFIAFVSTPDQTAALMVRPDGNVYGGWCTGSARKLRKTEAAFRRAIADPSANLNAVHSQAKALSAVLLGPIYEFLPERAVLIVQPDEGAGEVPFYALVDQHGNYLAQHYTIVITPHPPSSWSLPKGAPPDGRALAVRVEQTYGKRSLGDLTPEVAAVRSAYRQMVELANAQATRKDIAQELRTAAVFHFAGHSLELPESVGVSVSGNDAIDGHFVSSTPMPNLKLVVLAACSTAHSRFAAQDDKSLVGAFLAHGVPYVVATNWNVNSAATEQFVQAMYGYLGSGETVPEAVRLASLDLQKGKSTALPFYWAGFKPFMVITTSN
jgi:CHAT domain-containing protein